MHISGFLTRSLSGTRALYADICLRASTNALYSLLATAIDSHAFLNEVS
jgi:hypothetical protein